MRRFLRELKLKLIYDRQSVGQSVPVSGVALILVEISRNKVAVPEGVA
jgi:hypothetical protein